MNNRSKSEKQTNPPGGFKKKGLKPFRFLTSLLGGKEIEKRVEEDFPSWQEFSQQKLRDASERNGAQQVELPPHKVYISSPLQWNFLYFLIVAGSLAMAYAEPDWAPFFIYGAIILIFIVVLFVIARDGVFFHFEGQRLEDDSEMINKRAEGLDDEEEPEEPGGFLSSFTSKKKTVFLSKLFQIHYQNVLRTFEQGNRRTWVNQEPSITEIHTLLSQRGMKLVWTLIDVLPQLGLLGTLIGLARMFLAFRAEETLPEVSIIAGFGTALGTTILANLFVLILRPLYMRNERAMNEILSTLQILMAMFILPTQQSVLEKHGGRKQSHFADSPPGWIDQPTPGQGKLAKSIDELTNAFEGYSQAGSNPGDLLVSKEIANISKDVKASLHSFKETLNPVQVNFQHQVLVKLTEAVQGLTKKLEISFRPDGGGKASSKQVEHDLLQLRMLNRDTLVLLEQISDQMAANTGEKLKLLSKDPALRSHVFPEQAILENDEQASRKKSGSQTRKSAKSGLSKIVLGKKTK